MYFGSKISSNISETPEGYLICRNVPIGRTGYMEYLGEEIGDASRTGEKIKVYRDEDELFSKHTMASFEGKIVTNEHPPDLLTSENSQRYSKGAIQNVRRSKEETDLLLADLIIYEKKLIDEVNNGKREVSSGYDCIYTENEDGSYTQTSIRGNHVAVVEAGRAGYRVCIKDSINKEREVDIMTEQIQRKKATKTTRILTAMGLKHLAVDAEPEDLADVVDSMSEESQRNYKEPEKEKIGDEDVSGTGALEEKLDKLIAMMSASLSKGDEEDPEQAIDEIIEKIESNDEDESEVVGDEELEEEALDTEEELETTVSADSKAWAATLKAMKPVIASISDPTERKKACDSLINEYKKATKVPKNKVNGYTDIVNAQKKKAQDSAKKSQSAQDIAAHNEKLGEEIAKKYNANLRGGK